MNTAAAPFAVALAIIYLLAGAACAIGAWSRVRHLQGFESTLDVVWLVLLWPLHAPFVFATDGLSLRAGWEKRREQALLKALRQARGTSLSTLLPDAHTVRALCRSLRDAERRLREMDALLARPEMSELALERRLAAVSEPPGATEARGAIILRLESLRFLQATRERLSAHLQEVDALLDQLMTQASLVPVIASTLAPPFGAPEHPAKELLAGLVDRLETLGHLLREQTAEDREPRGPLT